MEYRTYILHVESESTTEEIDELAEIAARVIFAHVRGEGSSVEVHTGGAKSRLVSAFEK